MKPRSLVELDVPNVDIDISLIEKSKDVAMAWKFSMSNPGLIYDSEGQRIGRGSAIAAL